MTKRTPEASPPTAQQAAQHLERLGRYQAILADFSRMVTESGDADRLLQLATVQAARGIGIGHAKVMRYRPEHGDLLMVAGVGWRPDVVGHATFGTDPGSAPGQALQTRQPLVIYDLPNEPDTRNPPVLREHGIVSLLNVPIAVDGAVWGVLEVDSATPRHFGQDDAAFLLTMANVLGLALHGRMAAERAVQEQAAAALALAHQEVLLTELEHRFKNDFQLIQSLLMMQRRRLADEGARQAMRHVMDRVAAIGMAHDQLSMGGGRGGRRGSVELSDYLRALCGSLGQRREGVQVEAELARMEMPYERAVPLGLVVNELVTNALKHAFPDGRPGTVRVTLAAPDGASDGEATLCVQDDGAGLGPPREGSSGTELVRRLVQQVGGRLERIEQERGTGFRVRFPVVT